MTNINIILNKYYDIEIDNYVSQTVTSFNKLTALLSQYEFNTFSFEFDTYAPNKELETKEYKNFIRRLNKLAKAFGLEIMYVDNVEIDGFIFSTKFIGSIG